MNEAAKTMTGTSMRVWVHYAQMYLADPDLGTDDLPDPQDAADELLALGTDGACILTGLHTGYVNVTVHALPREPDGTGLEGAEAVVQGDFTSTTGSLQVHSWEDGPLDDLPNLTPHGPGRYRLRISARGRDLGRQTETTGPDDDIGESYLLETWPLS